MWFCRDEMTQGLVGAVGRRWDPPFSLGGLGALPSLGRTGWRAALSHVPDADGRGCLLVFGMPHLGIDPDGNVGQSLRPFQQHPTPTCGAMTALLRSLSSSQEPLPPGLDDLEVRRAHVERVAAAAPEEPEREDVRQETDGRDGQHEPRANGLGRLEAPPRLPEDPAAGEEEQLGVDERREHLGAGETERVPARRRPVAERHPRPRQGQRRHVGEHVGGVGQ